MAERVPPDVRARAWPSPLTLVDRSVRYLLVTDADDRLANDLSLAVVRLARQLRFRRPDSPVSLTQLSALATLAPASIVARSFVPPLPALVSEAKPLEPVTWLGGRSLTRHRPGVRGHVEVVGESLRVAGGGTLEFPLVDLPIDAAGRPLPLELVVTLAGSDAQTGTLIVRSQQVGGAFELGRIALPEPRDRVWSAPAIAWQPDRDRAALVVEFHGAPDETVLIRDIASFTTGDGIISVAER